jgi:hypothetical protein
MLPEVLQSFYFRKQEVIDYTSGSAQQVPVLPVVEPHQPVEGFTDTGSNQPVAADVYDDEVIVVEQPMNLSYYQDLNTDPIPVDLHASDLVFLQQALGGHQQQHYNIPAPQPVGYSYSIGNVHSSSLGNRGHTLSISTQQVSALDRDYFLDPRYDWNDAAHVDNDPEVVLWSQ